MRNITFINLNWQDWYSFGDIELNYLLTCDNTDINMSECH